MTVNGKKIIGQFIETIGNQLGIALSFEKGICHLSYGQGETLTIEVPRGSDVFIFYTSVFSLYNNEDLSLFKKLLSYSLLGRNTSGCCLGFDEETQKVILSYQDNVNRYNLTAFEDRMLAFAEEANKVRADLAKKLFEREQSSEKVVSHTDHLRTLLESRFSK